MAETHTADENPRRCPLTHHYDTLKTGYGQMIINTHDPCLECNLTENEKEIFGLCQFARGKVLDIGANIGSHTINFAKTADWVYSFEPQSYTFWNLCANILINDAYNVTPIQAAVSSHVGSTTVWNIDPHQRNTAMGVEVGKPIGNDITVKMVTIDSLEIPDIYFIKIDVEGHEFDVLKGGIKTFQEGSPIVYVEIHRADLKEMCLDFMCSILDYKAHEYVRTEYEQGTTWGYIFWKEGRIIWA